MHKWSIRDYKGLLRTVRRSHSTREYVQNINSKSLNGNSKVIRY